MDTVKVETDVSIDNEEDVIGLETDAVLCSTRVWTWGEPHLGLSFVVVVVDVYCCVWFCTHGTVEIDWFAVLFVCLELCICYNVKIWHIVLVLKYL